MSELYTSLDGIQLGESDSDITWVHAMPAKASVKHPVHGTIEFSPERIRRFADSVNNRVRGIDLDIDYEHKRGAHGGRAAGWVQNAEARDDGLWLGVSFTPAAKEAIKNREYRYFSPEFDDEWEDNSGQAHKDVLFGGGITNRPHLKSLQPYKLDEGLYYLPEDASTEPVKEGSRLSKFTETLQRFLGLTEDATDEQLAAAFQAKLASQSEPAPAPAPSPSPTPVQASEPTQDDNKPTHLVERDKRIKALEEQNKKQARELAETKVDRYLSGLAQDAEFTLSEPAKQAARRALLSADGDTAEALQDLLAQVTKTGLVEMMEYGYANNESGIGLSDPVGSVERRAKNLMEVDKTLDYRTAVKKVFAEDPSLYQQYERAVMNTGGGR